MLSGVTLITTLSENLLGFHLRHRFVTVNNISSPSSLARANAPSQPLINCTFREDFCKLWKRIGEVLIRPQQTCQPASNLYPPGHKSSQAFATGILSVTVFFCCRAICFPISTKWHYTFSKGLAYHNHQPLPPQQPTSGPLHSLRHIPAAPRIQSSNDSRWIATTKEDATDAAQIQNTWRKNSKGIASGLLTRIGGSGIANSLSKQSAWHT